ncbi:MAG: DUF2029 domain-containing protein [Kineosporiaceae bacterium]|nr:DUF2029 domain-containing protein [Kineosporiaceae bacterium]
MPAHLFALAGGAVLAAVAGVASYSVVRYHPGIVATYAVAAAVLAAALLSTVPGRTRARWMGIRQVAPAGALICSGVITAIVPVFTYLPAEQAGLVRGILATAAVLTGSLLLAPSGIPGIPRGPRGASRVAAAVLATASCGHVAAAVLLIRGDPAPEIDVWYTLQGAADALGAGRNIYTEVWVGPPGVMAAFTYLPWTALLLAPGRWLAGDVRVALVTITVVSAVALSLPGRSSERRDGGERASSGERTASGHDPRVGAGAGAVLLLLPGTATQIEQAWTEPLLAACLVVAARALRDERWSRAIIALAIGLACKQHLALLLPLLAAWPRFGVRRALVTAATAGLAVLPWLLADPRAMIEDTVAVLVRYPPMRFADSLYILSLNEFGWMPPFWLTGVVVLGVLGAVVAHLRRHDPSPAQVLGWGACVLLVANLVNKQAFYNQYWLVMAMIAIGWALAPTGGPGLRSGRLDRSVP